MASKINRKFVLVVGGFAAAAVLLLVAVVLVNQLWLKNAERHIRAGDDLVAQGKFREAYSMYGRALAKKPDVVRYVEKMEDALGKVVADTPAQSVEDYRNMMSLKRAHTRAQPGDPEQWRILEAALEDEAELFARGDGWIALESVGKEMKDAMPPGSDGLRIAEETVLYARGEREAALTPGERAELDRQLEAFVKVSPKSWRAWAALASVRASDVARLRAAGQEQAANRRREQLDAALAQMHEALKDGDAMSQVALADADLGRLLLEGRVGPRIDRSKLDKAKVDAACERLVAAALKSGSGRVVRSAVARIGDAQGIDEASKLLDTWLAGHANDVISAGLALEIAGRSPDQKQAYERTQAAARRILDLPTLPTSIASSIQPEIRARALQVLIEAAIVQIARGVDDAERDRLQKLLVELRAKLVAALQNDESSPGMLAADAKIAQGNGDLPGAAKKWETYFTKVPQPPADSFLWYTTVARAQNDLGLAMQVATKGSDAYPSDLRLAIQRAELATLLGRYAEAAGIYDLLAKALPDQEQFARLAEETRARSQGGTRAAAPAEVAQLDAALREKDWARARELASAWVASSRGSAQAMLAQAIVEQAAGDKAKALEFARAGLEKHPSNPDLARIEALCATDDPLERVDMMVKRMVKDPKQVAAERVRALRGLRVDLERQIAELRRASSPDLAKSEGFLKRIDAALPEAEKAALASGANDPGTIEMAFMEALSRNDVPAAEAHLAAAARLAAEQPILETVLRSRLLDYQGKVAEAIALLEKARQAGRSDAPLAAALADLQEKVGNEPAAMALWKDAYDRRPNDLANVRGYARAMGRSGQGRQSLDLLRPAAAANPADFDTNSMLAQYEAVYGSRSRAIEIRQRLVQLDPTNRENIGELYSLLFLPADYGSVRGPDGAARFDARGWAAVPADEQRRLLADAQAANVELAERIYRNAMEASPYDIRFAGRKAQAMREIGRFDEAARALADVIARAERDGKATAAMYTEQGLYFDVVGETAKADEAFRKAVALQDPKRREVDLVLAEREARRGNTPRAIELLVGAMGDDPSLAGLLRLADLQTVARRFDDAQGTMERIRAKLGKAPSADSQRQLEMLVAGIASGRADDLHNAGKDPESRAKVDEALAALGRAEAISPTDLFAPLRRVQILRGMSVVQRDPAKLDQAIAAADRALARNAMYWPMVSARADLALDKRDIKAATGIVERFLQAQPGSDEARIRLIDMYMAGGNAPRAIEVARAGAELHPQDAAWAERLGDLLDASGDVPAAAREYERAFTLDPRSTSFLEKAANARLSAGGAAEALQLLRGAGEITARSPVLRSIAAVAVAKSGKREEGIVAGREALAAARASKEDTVLGTERSLIVLRNLFAADRPADFEAFVVASGTPSAVECALIADAWARSGPSGTPKAVEWCGKVEAMGDSVPVGIRAGNALTKGTALYTAGDAAAACDSFVKAAALSGRNPAALNNAAYLLAKVKGDYAKAFEFATQAVTLAPSQPDYLDTLGYVLLKMGRLPDADDALTKSVAATPTASALLHLAQVRAAAGNAADARQLLDRARARPGLDNDTKKDIEDFAQTLKSN